MHALSNDWLRASFGRIANDVGLTSKARSWYRTTDETITAVGLQKSQYSNKFYLNLGVLIRTLDSTPYPTPTNCHVVFRGSDLLGAEAQIALAQALDVERDTDDDARLAVLREIMTDGLAPWIRRFGSIEGLRSMGDLLDRSAVRAVARPAVGLPER
jgi:hypothetical protein